MHDIDNVKKIINSWQDDEEKIKIYLKFFLESIIKADSCGKDKWGVYYKNDRFRLLVGEFIVMTVHEDKIWLALDKKLLEDDKIELLDKAEVWNWDTGKYSEYKDIPSRNGYYLPEQEKNFKSLVQKLHFSFIEQVANKYQKLNKKSELTHMPEVLDCLEEILEQDIPRPDYLKNINFLISQFEEKFTEDILKQADKIREEFVKKFPLKKLKELSLEEYALGLDNNNKGLCWWLEYNTTILGSIKGGSAHKHKIFFSRKKDSWIYPEEFNNEKEAWQKLRQEIYDFIINFQEEKEIKLEDYQIIDKMHAVRTKLLYMYFPEDILPMYNLNHIKRVLEYFRYFNLEKIDSVGQGNLVLLDIFSKRECFDGWDNLKFMKFVYKKIIPQNKYYKIAPGDKAKYWEDCISNNYICIGWDDTGDLRSYADYDDFLYEFHNIALNQYGYKKAKATEKANEIWAFYNLEPGDIIVANKGISKVVGIGEVNQKGYYYDESRNEYKHTVGVDWQDDFKVKEIEKQNYWALKTVYDISEKLYKKIKNSEEDESDNQIEEVEIAENDKKVFDQIDLNLKRKSNVILYGPPGTGKTYLTMKYIEWKRSIAKKEIEEEFITFHPSFAYEDFIEGYKPHSTKGKMDFKLEDGIFKRMCKKAAKRKDKDYYLIIDEINRGDVAKIFGEIITLLEPDKRELKLILSQSKEEFKVPENLYVIATMNTSDKSIQMMDAALRRRFAFIECMPNYELISENLEKLEITPKDILEKINRDLREIEDREKQIGHSYFMKDGRQIETIAELKEVYIYEIIPLVSEYCFNDYYKMGEIIGEQFIDKENENLKKDLINLEDFFISNIRKKFGEN